MVGAAHDSMHVEGQNRLVRCGPAEQSSTLAFKLSLPPFWGESLVRRHGCQQSALNKFVSKRQVLGMVRSRMLTFTANDRVIDYAHVDGDSVILAGRETVTRGSRMPLAGKTEHLLFTAVWMKHAGRWQEAARHANVVPPAAM